MNQHLEKLKGVVKGRVVIFIDAANLEKSVQGMKVYTADIPCNLKNPEGDCLRWPVDYSNF